MEFCDKESLLLFSLSSSRCLWAIDLIVTTIICRQWFQLKWFLAMIWPWLLFDYYHPKSSKSRFAQCFQWFSRNSAKQDVFGKNRTTLENTAFYPLMPENSDRRHCSCQALSLCKKARRKLMHLSLRLAFARTDCTPMTHCVPMGRNSWDFKDFLCFHYTIDEHTSCRSDSDQLQNQARFCKNVFSAIWITKSRSSGSAFAKSIW